MAMAVSSQQSRDAALLRATTELFVLDRSHDRDEVRRFEELATHFLGKVTAADRAFIAERLARHPDAPPSILRMLGKDMIEVASPILRHATSLAAFDLIAIMAASGPAHYRLIARRPNLPPEVIAALRMTDDAETLALLPPLPLPGVVSRRATIDAGAGRISDTPPEPRPTTAPIPTSGSTAGAAPAPTGMLPPLSPAKSLTATLKADFAALIGDLAQMPQGVTVEAASAGIATPHESAAEAGRARPIAAAPVGAQAVRQRPAVQTPAPLPGARSFLLLGRDERIAVLERHSSPVASPTRAASPLELDRAFQAAVNRAKVPALARQKQRSALIQTIAAGLELNADIVEALMDDPSGEALVVLLKAIGLSDSEAQQVLLLANPTIGEAVGSFFRLVQLFGRLDRGAAESLVLHWRRTASDDRSPRHVPHHAATEPVRGARPAPAKAAKPVDDVPERTVFGRRGL